MIVNPKGIPGYLYKELFFPRLHVPKVEYKKQFLSKKIITLFVHYNNMNIIDESDVMYLHALSEISDVVFITNSDVSSEYIDAINIKFLRVIRRDNIGFDFGAWKDGIKACKADILLYDCIVLANNSVFFPAYNLCDVFGLMDSREGIDFWGITAFTENKFISAPERRFFDKKRVPQHIQSYFLVFKGNMINDCFFAYWDNLEYTKSFVETVEKGELSLTSYFSNKGYSWDVLIQETKSDAKFHFDGPDMTKNEPDILLYYGCPFIKKKSLIRITNKQVSNLLSILNHLNPELKSYIKEKNKEKKACKTYKILNGFFKSVKDY